MPSVARQGDSVLSKDGSGYKCSNPMETTVGECNNKNVYCNGILVVVEGNQITPHPKYNCETDTSVLTKFSNSVFIGNKGIGRIGDKYTDNNVITQGSTNVFSN